MEQQGLDASPRVEQTKPRLHAVPSPSPARDPVAARLVPAPPRVRRPLPDSPAPPASLPPMEQVAYWRQLYEDQAAEFSEFRAITGALLGRLARAHHSELRRDFADGLNEVYTRAEARRLAREAALLPPDPFESA